MSTFLPIRTTIFSSLFSHRSSSAALSIRRFLLVAVCLAGFGAKGAAGNVPGADSARFAYTDPAVGASLTFACFPTPTVFVSSSTSTTISYSFLSSDCDGYGFTAISNATSGTTHRIFATTIISTPVLQFSRATATGAITSGVLKSTSGAAFKLTNLTIIPITPQNQTITITPYRSGVPGTAISFIYVATTPAHPTTLTSTDFGSSFDNIDEFDISTNSTTGGFGITDIQTTTPITAVSNNASLSSLLLSSGSLAPSFASGTTSYTASVANSTTSITVTPTTSDANATVKVNGTAVTSGSASGSISLAVGTNTITTVVTAQDGTTTSTYTVVVTRAASSVATLSNLAISSGTLAPSFASGTTSYTASVAYSTTSITVTPTTSDANATVKVNGTAVTSGSASGSISLAVGTNTITTVVTAQDGTTTATYTVVVTRAASSVATLSALSLSSGTLAPSFASGTTSYTASVANSTTSITVTPTTSDANATVKVNGTTVTSGSASGSISLAVGTNTITTVVTAQDGITTATYTVVVTRAASSVATLSALSLSSGTLTPAFASGTTSYTASVSNATTFITVTPTTSDVNATVTVNGTTVTSGSASGSIGLDPGFNSILIEVTAQDGTTTVSYEVDITKGQAFTATISSQTDNTCHDGVSGSATVSVSGGIAPYSYSWSPSGGTGATASNLAAGAYTCTVLDANGATATATATIASPPGPGLSIAIGAQTNVSCFGDASGSATISASGGLPSYLYAWSPGGSTSATASGLATGTYTCTVTDGYGCAVTQNVIITQPLAALASTINAQTDVSCNGGSNGSATISAGGGTSPYTYSWSPSGGTAASATGLAAGSYTCTITDANGCTATQNVTISQPAALTAAISAQTDVSCNGGSNGSATISAGGGTSPYTYSWSPSGGTAASATGLTAGSYTCTITDAHGCTATQNVTISQPAALTAAISAQADVSCNGGSNGSATVSAGGGTSPYTYSWSPSGGTAASATGLTAGSYTCTITDAHGCTATQNVTISQPAALTAAISAQTDVSCNGGSNGSATVSAGGGTSPYTYSWSSSGGTAASATGLAAGSYTCTITDANGCTATQNVTISQPAALTAAISAQADVSCNGGSNGSATVSAGGGTSPYTYSWSPSGGTAASATGLTAGSYTCTITDAHGCTATQNVTISQPAVLTAAISAQADVSCNGGSNGSATVSAGGGTSPYTYSWSPSGGTAASATGLTAGSYTCTITDAHGCTATQNVTISQPAVLTAAISAQADVSCNGGSNGSATVSAGGGTSPYTYSWSPSGGTAASATGLAAGSYTCTITDAHGCTATQNVTISQPAALAAAISAKTDVSCNGGSNGSATISASGGTSPYTYSWSPSGGTAASATGLAAGSYTCTITDAHGCTASISLNITQPALVTPPVVSAQTFCARTNPTVANLQASGTGIQWYGSAGSSTPLAGTTGLSNGTYYATQTIGGCQSSRSAATVNINTSSVAPTGINTPSLIVCDTNATTSLSVTGGSLGTGAVWKWYSGSCGGTAIGTGPSLTNVTLTQTTSFYVRAEGPCETSACATITVQYASRSNLVSQHWSNVLIFDNSGGNYNQWQWYRNGSAVAGANGQYYSESSPLSGQYYVVATDQSGNSIQTCPLSLTPGSFNGLRISMFPNPVIQGAPLSFISSYSNAQLQHAILTITDLRGSVWKTVSAVQTPLQFFAPQAAGMYIVTLQLANGQKASLNLLVY